MDVGAFNVSITWLAHNRPNSYKYYVFINSSLRGPFMPKWAPENFHFTDVLTQYFKCDPAVKLVGSYITCLSHDEPLPGPIMESLFFAVDNESLSWLVQDHVFARYVSKMDTALKGEYIIMPAVLKRGGKVESLNMQYAQGLDWRDRNDHHCNDNRHSSRRGSQDGISPMPLEHIFVKIPWCVRAVEVSVLSKWLLQLVFGYAGTSGQYDRTGYFRGISTEGTRGKSGTLPPDVMPDDLCTKGDLRTLHAP